MLYLIEILHQTTTLPWCVFECLQLYLIEILHQTTTSSATTTPLLRCILSKFYIKPQPLVLAAVAIAVVSYRNSTSNHNLLQEFVNCWRVVSYRNSTSNHNKTGKGPPAAGVVSYRNSTSNHNQAVEWSHGARVVSYRNSTSNHNSN